MIDNDFYVHSHKGKFYICTIEAFVTLQTLHDGKISWDVHIALSCEITMTVLTNNVTLKQ